MKKIGITGNIATGKSTVEKIISNFGFKVVDADKICHCALEHDEQCVCAVRELFKDYAVFKDGKIDRAAIGKIVFDNTEFKKGLENILHPIVKSKILDFFNQNSDEDFVFVSAALLFEADMQDYFDKIILVTAHDDIRLNRLMKRNNLSKEEALKRINAQKPQEEKIKLADFVIKNNSGLEELKFNTENILKLLH